MTMREVDIDDHLPESGEPKIGFMLVGTGEWVCSADGTKSRSLVGKIDDDYYYGVESRSVSAEPSDDDQSWFGHPEESLENARKGAMLDLAERLRDIESVHQAHLFSLGGLSSWMSESEDDDLGL
jgi:hypothetical protein